MVIVRPAAIVMVNGLDVVPDALSFTCTVNVNVPDPLGVPKMAPPAAFSVKPAGRAPALTLHV